MPYINHQWLLAARPKGMLRETDFEWNVAEVPTLGPGQLLIRNIYLSLDPTNRAWMNSADTYLPALALGDVMRGFAIGIVEASNNPAFGKGTLVQGLLGWQKYTVSNGRGLTAFTQIPGTRLDAYMGYFGMIGMTAYFGLMDIGQPKSGETLVVSAAAGAVGSLVCQIGKIAGCRVVGIAGSDEKCAYLTDTLGVDGAINYKNESVRKALKTHCPDGIDLYFDNVGGEILDAVLSQINIGARIMLCGMISQYNAKTPQPGPYYLSNLIVKRAKMEGFLVMDYNDRADEANQALAQWLLDGKVQYRTDIVQGLEQAPRAIQKLFSGQKQGKLLVEVSAPPA